MSGTLFDDPELSGAPQSVDEKAARPLAGSPLADRMRPRSLDDVVGHQKIVGMGGFLRQAIAEDRVPSLIFWGPPGTGKTTIAKIIAAETSSHFAPFSAVTSGIREVKNVMGDARKLRRATGRRTLLFVDEIHRFNRAQQDAFLPYVETGDIVLVGATTENPSFELNSALLSRCRVVVLSDLSTDELVAIVERALGDAAGDVLPSTEALEQVAQLASGDARRALNLLEEIVADAMSKDRREISPDDVRRVAQRKTLRYDKSGEEHFNLISALHKSLRESDADAALYWLVRMLEGGEDPLYVARRMVRFASEDVGLADPAALQHALAAWDAFHRLGSPEGEIFLAQTAIYLALAPKSNAVYRALGAARSAVQDRPAEPVPAALRNAPTQLMKDVGYGEGHVYAHATEEGVGGMECLPSGLRGHHFYEPGKTGFEAQLATRLARFEELRMRARADSSEREE